MASQLDITAFNFSDKRKDLVKMARIAETGERYEDMCMFIRALVKEINKSSDLTVEERNLLSVAYKNVVGARRATWRTFNSEEYKDDTDVAVYRQLVENEVEKVCKDVLDLLENHLLAVVLGKGDDAEVFYNKMIADYYRYLAEIFSTKGYAEQAGAYYKKAMEVASQKMNPTNPIRLGLALNYSVCCYEILKDPKSACDMAKTAFDDAISKLDQLDEASYKDSTLIMQLLRDNLTLWTSDQEQAGDEDADRD